MNFKSSILYLYQYLFSIFKCPNPYWDRKKEYTLIDKNSLSIVTMIRNEDKYLKEWIDHHINFGVQLFVIYDNAFTKEDSLKTKSILKNYIKKGIILYIRWKDIEGTRIGTEKISSRKKVSSQELAYFHFRQKVVRSISPLYFIKLDVDEFLYKKDGSKISLKDLGNDVMRIYGYNFGSSGLISYEETEVTKRFLNRSHKLEHFKSINKIKNTRWKCNAHEEGYNLKNFILKRIFKKVSKNNKNLVLNHYRLKSKNEFFNRKVNIPLGYTKNDYKEEEFFILDRKMNEVYDNNINKLYKS